MKTKLCSALLLAAITLLFTVHCSKPLRCPACPNYLVDYYPYEGEKNLVFVNERNDTLLFTIDHISHSDAYSNVFGKSDCGFGTSLRAYCDLGYEIGGGAGSGSNPPESRINFGINIRGAGSDDFSKILPPLDASEPDDYAPFGDTVVFTREDAVCCSRVVIVKGKGITEFFDVAQNCLWKKIN